MQAALLYPFLASLERIKSDPGGVAQAVFRLLVTYGVAINVLFFIYGKYMHDKLGEPEAERVYKATLGGWGFDNPGGEGSVKGSTKGSVSITDKAGAGYEVMRGATKEAGVPESWADLDSTWNILANESSSNRDSLNCSAQNPTSTAFGLGQFLDTTWSDVGEEKTSDCYRQAVAFWKYVLQRYGHPDTAWEFWLSHNWY